MMQNETPTVSTSTATVYGFYWKRYGYPVKVIIDDERALLVVVTDHGVVEHQWSGVQEIMGSPTLTLALTSWSSGYVASKLLSGCPDEMRERFDGEATKNKIRAAIKQLRREGEITKDQARDAYNDLGYCDFESIHDLQNIPGSIEDVLEWEYLSEMYVYKPTYLCTLLYEVICPVLRAELIARFNPGEAAE